MAFEAGSARAGDAGRLGGRVLIVTGLAFEARIARRCRGADVLYGIGDAIDADMNGAVGRTAAHAAGIVSFGTAGGLDPALKPGDCLLAESVIVERHGEPGTPRGTDACAPTRQAADGAHDERHVTDRAWLDALARALPDARRVTLAASSIPVSTATAKAALFARTGAAAVDMESHHLARLAERHGLPFAVCRVIVDSAERTLPPAALASMRADGHTDWPALLAALWRQPSQVRALLRLGGDAARARRVMRTISDTLPPRFALTVGADTHN